MNNKLAIKELEKIAEMDGVNKIAIIMAIDALELQSHKEPVQESRNFVTYYLCPTCDNVVEKDEDFWCPSCGQSLFWRCEDDN